MPDRWWRWCRRPASGEAETYARLEAAVRDRDMRACDGCTRCAMRCVDGIDLSYSRVCPPGTRCHGDACSGAGASSRPGQGAALGGRGAVVALCSLPDRDTDRCAIYPVRLICRLFGYAPWLPCPTGKQNTLIEGRGRIMVERVSSAIRCAHGCADTVSNSRGYRTI